MSPIHLLKTFVVVVVFGFLAIADSEARTLNQQAAVLAESDSLQNDASPNFLANPLKSNVDQIDIDDDDDDDDKVISQPLNPVSATGTNLFFDQPIQAEQTHQKYRAVPSTDLKTSATHHHHGHGTKGWLDMGAWTGKKGAFGWYDKHPVGKGK